MMESALVIGVLACASAGCAPAQPWAYETSKACKLSQKTIFLQNAPISETEQRVRLCVLKSGGAALSTEHLAPVLCPGETCAIEMRFDDGDYQVERAIGAQGPRSAAFVFVDGAYLTRKVAESRALRVRMPDDQGRTQALDFDLTGLDWSKAP